MRAAPYTGKLKWENDFYIHQHVYNIGKANNMSLSANALMSNYEQQKKQAIETSKSIFKTNLKNSLSKQSQILLNEVYSDSMTEELTNQIGAALQEAVSLDKIALGIQKQREIYNINIGAKLINSKGKERVEAFNKLLQALSDLCRELESDGGNVLANLLVERKDFGANTSLGGMGRYLSAIVQKFITKNPVATIDEQRVSAAAETINQLANMLMLQETSSGKDVTARSINQMMTNIFSTGFQESFGSMIQDTAKIAINNEMAKLTGAAKTKMAVYDASGKLVRFESPSAYGKADISLPNVKVNIEAKNGLNGGTITIDLGLSNKAYRTQHVPGLDNNLNKQEYGGGSGGTLGQALSDLYGSDVQRYLAYNISAHQQDESIVPLSYKLNDLILTRELNRIFSARGTSDFAQYMLVNGKVISIWELIVATENFVGLSASVSPNEQPVILSIPDRPAIIKASKLVDDYARIKQVNSAINKAVITAHIHVNKLRNVFLTD